MVEKNNDRHIVAIEIGSSKVRGSIGVVDDSGILEVIATEEEKLIDKVRYGCIQNIEVATALNKVLVRLESCPQVEPRKIVGAYVALGARSLTSQQIDIELDLPGDTEITRKLISELKHQAAAKINSDTDAIDVIPVRYSVDNKVQKDPIGSFGSRLAARTTVLSISPQVKRMLHRMISERLNLNINGFITRPLAEADIVLTDDERRLGCMFVDFGAETTTVSIYRDGAPVYVRVLPMGSRNITRDITVLNYIEERAEEIKKNYGNATPPDPTSIHAHGAEGIDYTQVNQYVNARCEEIVANIIQQIEYAGLKDADIPQGIIIVGGGAKMRGFNELLHERSKLQVRSGAPTMGVRLIDGSVNGSDIVDVVAVLVAASKMPDAECLTPYEEVHEEHRTGGAYTPDHESYDTIEDDPEDDGKARFDQDDDDDEDDFGDDFENEDKPAQKKKGKKNKKKDSETDDEKTNPLRSMLMKIQDRVTSMLGDPDEPDLYSEN